MEDVLLPLALILLASEAGGFLTGRLGLTRVAGQIGAGLVLGPSLLGVVTDGPTIRVLSGVGALCILAVAGLETDLRQLRSVGRPAMLAALGGVAVPMIGGSAIVHAFGYDARTSLFCGAVLTATSVGITAAALRELGRLGGPVGATILAAAVIDDVLGLAVLSLVVAETGDGGSPIWAITAMLVVLGGAAIGGRLVRDHLVTALDRLHVRGGGLAAMLGLAFATAWLFQSVGGLAGITGAYAAGVVVAGSPVAERLRGRLVHAGEALCVPVFFVAIGLSADVRTVATVAPAALALLAVAVAGKLVGSGLGARLGGLDRSDSVGVGIGMVARGEVALVAATIGRSVGAIDAGLYSALVLVALATTVLTPTGLALWAARPKLRGLVGEPVVTSVAPAFGRVDE